MLLSCSPLFSFSIFWNGSWLCFGCHIAFNSVFFSPSPQQCLLLSNGLVKIIYFFCSISLITYVPWGFHYFASPCPQPSEILSIPRFTLILILTSHSLEFSTEYFRCCCCGDPNLQRNCCLPQKTDPLHCCFCIFMLHGCIVLCGNYMCTIWYS